MAHLRRVMDVHGDPTRFYLHRAMPLTDQRIEDFNDFALTYDEIRTVIVAAREIAQAELDAARDRLRTNRRLQPDQRAIARAGEISCRGSRQSGGGDLRSLIPRACRAQGVGVHRQPGDGGAGGLQNRPGAAADFRARLKCGRLGGLI